MKAIKYILFDCGNVLVGYDYLLGYKKLASESPIPLSVEKIASALGGEAYSRIYNAFQSGKLTIEEFSALESKVLGVELPVSLISHAFQCIFFAENKEIEHIFEEIKPDIKLRILSNTNPIAWGYWKNLSVVKNYFKDEEQFLSFRMGARKPDKEIYMKALKTCDCEIGEVLLVDDKERNTEPFKELGGNAIVYNCRLESIDELRKKLKEFDVLK